MNAHVDVETDPLDQARANATYLLGVVEHYSRLVRLHLELRDDAGTIYDLALAREHFLRAVRTLDPVRVAMRDKAAKAEAE